jgi:DNA-binding PadR family transcriptional regulator
MINVLLALLAVGRDHGYELKQAIEEVFGVAWPPVNIGQIYTTLARLERDGLVESEHVPQDGRPDKRVYSLTDAGRVTLRDWIDEPVGGAHLKDEFYTKLVLARLPGVTRLDGAGDPIALIQRQRREYLAIVRQLNLALLRQEEAGERGSSAALLIEGALFHIEADLKWLDLCERRLTESI